MGRFRLFLLALVSIPIVFAGCDCDGGTESKPTPTVKYGYLGSGDVTTTHSTYSDLYRFQARSSGTATISLDSSDFDEELWLVDSFGIAIQIVDNSAYLPEVLYLSVSSGSTYYIAATTYGTWDTGNYTLTFSDICRNVTQLSSLPSSGGPTQPELTDPSSLKRVK